MTTTADGRTTDLTTPGARDESSTSELLQQVAQQASRLAHGEIALAKAEMSAKTKRLGIGGGLLGGAGVFALFGVGILLAAAVLGLATVLAAWAAALIVGATVLGLAGLAALVGRTSIANGTPPLPQEAIADVRLDVAAVKTAAKAGER